MFEPFYGSIDESQDNKRFSCPNAGSLRVGEKVSHPGHWGWSDGGLGCQRGADLGNVSRLIRRARSRVLRPGLATRMGEVTSVREDPA